MVGRIFYAPDSYHYDTFTFYSEILWCQASTILSRLLNTAPIILCELAPGGFSRDLKKRRAGH